MSLERPTTARATLVLLVMFAAALAPAAPVLAHNGLGGATSDYLNQVTGFEGNPSGIVMRVVELGNRLEIVRTTAKDVMVLGYDGDPYLHLDAQGVAENHNSRAYYLNISRYASDLPPASAGPQATPDWVMVSTGTSVRWHDHRAHWMSATPRADVVANPDVERVIFPANRIDMIIDGRKVTALVRVTWLPPPDKTIWLASAAILGGLLATALVFAPAARRAAPSLAVLAAVAAFVGQGPGATRAMLAIATVAVALLGLAIRRPVVSAAAGLAAGALAATRLDVFAHELLAGVVPAVWQRIAVAAAIALALGVVGAAAVDTLSPSQTAKPAAGGVDADA